MPVQTYAQKRQDEIIKRARQLHYRDQDNATQEALHKAYAASRRARALLRELEEI